MNSKEICLSVLGLTYCPHLQHLSTGACALKLSVTFIKGDAYDVHFEKDEGRPTLV